MQLSERLHYKSKWFAWRPVWVQDGRSSSEKLVWLEFVWRRYDEGWHYDIMIHPQFVGSMFDRAEGTVSIPSKNAL